MHVSGRRGHSINCGPEELPFIVRLGLYPDPFNSIVASDLDAPHQGARES